MSDSVNPTTSGYQATPWQPYVDTSASDSGDEKSAAKTYDQDYGGTYSTTAPPAGPAATGDPVPTVTTAYTTAPDLIPLPNTSGSSSGGTTAPLADQFSIQLGDLMTAETACLNATDATLTGYQTLSSVVNNAISSTSIFGQLVGTQSNVNPDSKAGWLEGDGVTYDKLDSEGTSFASALVPQMQQLMYAIGNSVEAMGRFSALLNNAGQMYTDTDAQSAFPPPGLMDGPNPTTGP